MDEREQPDLFTPTPTPDRPRRPDDPPFGQRIREVGERDDARILLRRLERGGFVFVLREDGTVNVTPRPAPEDVEQLVAAKKFIVEILGARP
jgi:hypothetical protein